MSYTLVIFEKSKAPIFYEDFLGWKEQTEARDYNSIDGTSPSLVSWFMEMKAVFPPLNGEFSPTDEEINSDPNLENKLMDYTIGSNIIEISLTYSMGEDAEQLCIQYANKYQLGWYDPQTGQTNCHIISCELSTESETYEAAVWEDIERNILTLDSTERGTSYRNLAFITLAFKNNGTDNEFMQCFPNYPKVNNFFHRLFGSKHDKKESTLTYNVEAGTGEKIYFKKVDSLEQVASIFQAYYKERKLPNLDGWVDSGIL